MAIVPVHSERKLPRKAQEALDVIPSRFLDDGLSGFPDSIFGWNIKPAGRLHDARYCTRLWPPGTMSDDWKRLSDKELRDNVWALLPFGLRMAGLIVFIGVWRGGYGSFDSCGIKARHTTTSQKRNGVCRHNMPVPAWMHELKLYDN